MQSDPRDMTIRDLCALARQIKESKVGSRRYRKLNDRMAIAATYLDDSGALAQMLWWAQDTQPEAPPDAKAEVVEFPARPGPQLIQ